MYKRDFYSPFRLYAYRCALHNFYRRLLQALFPFVCFPKLPFRKEQSGLDRLVHIEIPVKPQPPAEKYVFFAVGKRLVFLIEQGVFFVVDRVIGLVPAPPGGGIFARDISERTFCLFEMLMLDNARIGNFPLGVIDDGVALKILRVEPLRFEAKGMVFEFAETVAVKLIDHARITFDQLFEYVFSHQI